MFEQIQPNRMAEAMRQLSDEHREVLIFIMIKGMSYEEASKAMNVSHDTVRNVLSSARASLQRLLDAPLPVEKKIYMNPIALGFVPSLTHKAA